MTEVSFDGSRNRFHSKLMTFNLWSIRAFRKKSVFGEFQMMSGSDVPIGISMKRCPEASAVKLLIVGD